MSMRLPLFAGLAFEGISPRWWWLWPLLALAGVAFLYWTYRGIFLRSRRRLSWILMLLRGLGLILLVLALAKPSWTRQTDQADPGRVALIIDNSRSMSLADQTGRARYARARAALEDLTQSLQTGRQPRLVVDFYDINGAPLGDGLPSEATADHTDLARALQRAISRERSGLLTAVVLISDGMDNSGRPNFRDWEGGRFPIHTLGFPETDKGDLDLAVEPLQVQARARVHNAVPVRITVIKKGQAAARARLHIKRGRDILASREVEFGPGEGRQEVSVTFTPHEPGSFVLTAAVETSVAERDLGNNSQHFPLRVDTDPIRIFYLEGFLRYEFRYLKAHLQDDPDVELRTSVRRSSPEGTSPSEKDFPTDAQLKDCHIVILGDMEGSFLKPAECQRLLRWLDGKEHALLVIGGYRSLGPEGLCRTPLASVLPFAPPTSPPYQSEKTFRLRLTPDGRRHPLFALSRDQIQDAATWEAAPVLQGMALVGPLKPDAEVLAVNPTELLAGKPVPVLTVRRAGNGGHVMVLTADTTWLWSRVPRLVGQPDTLYSRFWSQAVRWLAGRSLDEERPLLALSTDQPAYDAGKCVLVTLRRQPRPGFDLAASQPAVDVHDPAGKTLSLPLKSDSAEPDRFVAEYYPSGSGRYELQARLMKSDKVLANQTADFQVQGVDVELADTGTNPQNLRDLAQATGGLYRDIDQAQDLVSKIERTERHTVITQRSEYWNSPWLFACFLAFVTGEWLLRRRNHLI